jgi:hypothetical protein
MNDIAYYRNLLARILNEGFEDDLTVEPETRSIMREKLLRKLSSHQYKYIKSQRKIKLDISGHKLGPFPVSYMEISKSKIQKHLCIVELGQNFDKDGDADWGHYPTATIEAGLLILIHELFDLWLSINDINMFTFGALGGPKFYIFSDSADILDVIFEYLGNN